MVHFVIEPRQAVLLVVDMQRCFVGDSPIAAPDAQPVARRLNALVRVCRSAAMPVIWTRHVVRPDGSNAGLLARMVPLVSDGIIDADSPSAALHEVMEISENDIVIDKPHFGGFVGTDLETILRSRGANTIILGGINTNMCVDTTAREAAAREFQVIFLSDGTANFDLPDGGLGPASAEDLQRTACAVMAFGFAEVLTVAEAIERIEGATQGAGARTTGSSFV
ncbi:cysteine hydrolase [Saccharopolyspora sp. K220]|uniref:cysteine hydrolase family protein n=1 Tax=Saccharopolyspora soli TaxID=2926618 RepID=UPI001F565995|nr:isochorismatase family cysteine hydrolase [Saccharopolyspora soli]MCI2421520.1 cysteine hydrolase [Saccharopolyspora soli]